MPEPILPIPINPMCMIGYLVSVGSSGSIEDIGRVLAASLFYQCL